MLEINSLKAEIMDTEHVHWGKKHGSVYLSMKFPFPQRSGIRQLFKLYSHKTCKCLKIVQWFVCMYIFQNIKKNFKCFNILFIWTLSQNENHTKLCSFSFPQKTKQN